MSWARQNSPDESHELLGGFSPAANSSVVLQLIVQDRDRHLGSENVRQQRQLMRQVGRCIADFRLIEKGDRIMCCLSGGKDSYAMITLLRELQRKAPVRFELIAVHLDQGHPGYDGAPLRDWLAREEFVHHIVREDTYSIVVSKIEPGATYCSLCSRLRRGILYTVASELGCTKIALGHHRDDAIETLMLNLMFAGSMKSMPPRLQSDDGKHTVIRPLMYCAESDLAAYSTSSAFPILPCDLCGTQENLKRKQVKNWLNELEKDNPRLRESMLGALTNVRPSHLLDRSLWGRLGIFDLEQADDLSAQRMRSLGAAGPGKISLPVVNEDSI